ncbi:hypothetical protein [Microcoleus sp. FACHB-672]|uniref:hypothetical protein n=1 Tax=Microcoleus sp. FACHB-672 TaxID=2692825 RepID=UPI00168799B1|nr:hypothetical protein [Microcoleus sp. FACHB-672]MBD2040768.1 hypothetical protein [Microcoleus sp. FACHB-672]
MVSSHLDRIQELIADIDGVLRQPSSRLPWMGETAKDSRRVLERTRSYLLELRQQIAANDFMAQTAIAPPATNIQPVQSSPTPQSTSDPVSIEQALQAVVQDMMGLRANLMQPLQADVEALQRERNTLLKEIRQLDAQRQQQHTLAQQSAYQQQIISEFLQVLMGRVHESLTQQVSQTLNNIEHQLLNYESVAGYQNPALEGAGEPEPRPYIPVWDPSAAYRQVSAAPLHPRQRLEQMQALQQKSDELLMTLDSTISVVFEALLRNVHGYEESLSTGLEKMHNLGQQGETMFTHLVNHLALKLGQEAAGFLQSPTPVANLEPASGEIPSPTASQAKLPASEAKKKRELSPPPAQAKATEAQAQTKAKRRSVESTATPAQKGGKSGQDQNPAGGSQGSVERESPVELESAALSFVEPAPSVPDNQAVIEELLMDLEVGSANSTQSLDALLPTTAINSEATETEQEDFDAWVDLLGAEWQQETAAPTPETSPTEAGLTAGEVSAGMEQQLNDLYDNLFGVDEEAVPAQSAEAAPAPSESAGLNLFEEALFEGFTETAEGSIETSLPAQATEPAAQSLEEFLFFEDEPAADQSPENLEDLFEEKPAEVNLNTSQVVAGSASVTEVAANGADNSDVKETPSDLFPEPAAPLAAKQPPDTTPRKAKKEPAAQTSDEPDALSLFDDWAADSYIPASPDENLLPTSIEEEDPDRDLAVKITTLQQLQNDLFSLEGFDDFSAEALDVPADLDVAVNERTSEKAGSPLEPTPTPPERLPQQNWESTTLGQWAEEIEVSQAPAPTSSPNLGASPDELSVSDLAATPEEEALLASVDDWFAELAGESEALPADWPNSNPPLAPRNTPNMTLEEAFASMSSATASPAPQDLFESTDSTPKAISSAASAEDAGSSTLDDLFASMTEEPSAPVQGEAPDLFEPQNWNPAPTGTVSPDDMGTSTLDDLFASLSEDFPVSSEPSVTETEAFPTQDLGTTTLDNLLTSPSEDFPPSRESEKPRPVGSLTDMLADEALPPVEPAPPDSSSEKKKDLKPANLLQVFEFAPPEPAGIAENRLAETQEVIQPVAKAQPPAIVLEEEPGEKIWYLGIDFGSTGLSAALLNRQSCEVYPVYWMATEPAESGVPVERLFRLSTAVSRPDMSAEWAVATENSTGMQLEDFKPFLKLGMTGTKIDQDALSHSALPWEPVLQWSAGEEIPLSWLQQALAALLATLNPLKNPPETGLLTGAAGLESATFQSALTQLAGVFLNQPAQWPDSYSFNLREAVLGAGLVRRAEQVVVVEDAIATVLSVVRGAAGETLSVPSSVSQKLDLFNADSLGETLILSAGAVTSELALVNLPANLQDLTYSDFNFLSCPYAGDAIDQDIICQLLLKSEPRGKTAFTFPALQDLPQAGQPDLHKRYQLQQLLHGSAEGKALLEAAKHLKVILQHQDRFNLELGNQRWTCTRKELESRVFVPFVQRLNRELNVLLSQTGIQPVAIDQAICTGATASLPAIARWLRQKLPNATIIQDTYQDRRPPACSRIACGLAALPLHPQVFDIHRQQYSDFFLLRELLSAFPNSACNVAEIVRLLERRGINTRACQARIFTILEGALPAGLLPSEIDAVLLNEECRQDPDFLGLNAAPLFYKEDNQTYRPNPQQFQRLRTYFNQLVAGTYQQLEEPFTVDLGQRFQKSASLLDVSAQDW